MNTTDGLMSFKVGNGFNNLRLSNRINTTSRMQVFKMLKILVRDYLVCGF